MYYYKYIVQYTHFNDEECSLCSGSALVTPKRLHMTSMFPDVTIGDLRLAESELSVWLAATNHLAHAQTYAHRGMV